MSVKKKLCLTNQKPHRTSLKPYQCKRTARLPKVQIVYSLVLAKFKSNCISERTEVITDNVATLP